MGHIFVPMSKEILLTGTPKKNNFERSGATTSSRGVVSYSHQPRDMEIDENKQKGCERQQNLEVRFTELF